MNPFLSFFLRTAISIPFSGFVWLVSFFGFDQTFWISTGTAIIGGGVAYYTMKGYMRRRFIKAQGLTRKEYKYIEKNLEEAKGKIKRLNKALFSSRNLPQIKQNLDVIRVTRKIYSITKKEPKRFYLGEKFFFYHLDSFVELAEKYVFLSSQPTKNRELDQSLAETRWLIEELTHTVEKDLDQVLSNDINQLNFELDVAKHNITKFKDSEFHDESRR